MCRNANTLLQLVAVATLASLATSAVAQPAWKHVGRLGQRQLVVIETSAATDLEMLKKAAAASCVPKQPCVVGFWSDAAEVPRSMPMSAVQQQAMVAQYIRNPKSGQEELLLKCTPDTPSGTKCMH